MNAPYNGDRGQPPGRRGPSEPGDEDQYPRDGYQPDPYYGDAYPPEGSPHGAAPRGGGYPGGPPQPQGGGYGGSGYPQQDPYYQGSPSPEGESYPVGGAYPAAGAPQGAPAGGPYPGGSYPGGSYPGGSYPGGASHSGGAPHPHGDPHLSSPSGHPGQPGTPYPADAPYPAAGQYHGGDPHQGGAPYPGAGAPDPAAGSPYQSGDPYAPYGEPRPRHPGGQAPHQQPPATGYPDPQIWPSAGTSERTTQLGRPHGAGAPGGASFTGADPLSPQAHQAHEGGQQDPADHDAFAYLFRDQQQPPPSTQQWRTEQYQHPGPPSYGAAEPPTEPDPEPEPVATPPARPAGRASSLLKSSAIMAAGTLVSRLTGFVRQLVIIAALGAAMLGDSYNVAMSLPTMIYILTIGGGLNSVFVPQLVRAMKDDQDGGEGYANRLLTLVSVVLGALVLVAVFAAPLLIRLMSVKIADDPAANEVAVTFARYCLPTIFFMGLHVVLGQILNARGYFGPMMWTPVLNNIVVIFSFGLFIYVYGAQRTSHLGVTTITPEGLRLLGVGTLLGLTVQSLAMLPYLRNAGFRVRPRFDWRGHGMGKAARLAKWTVLFVLANQAGLVVVAQLATWAGDSAADQGYPGTGYIGYNSALLIWQMPQAIITVSVMAALLPRISRSAADGDTTAVRDDLSHGLRTSAVAIVPIAFAFVALGVPMCTLMFGSSGETSARSIGYILMAFGLGLIPFSAQYVVLRAFYAYEDTRTPFYNTVIVSAIWSALSGLCFVALPDRWVVAGIGFSYGVAYAVGVAVAWGRLRKRLGSDLDGAHITRTYARLVGASIPATLLGGAAGYGITKALGSGVVGSLASLTGGSIVLFAVFYLAARRMRIEELTAMVGMVRARLGR